MTIFQNKYRIEQARLKDWDYRRTGAYFITICTKNKQNFFGTINNDTIELNGLGLIIKNEWLKTFQRRKYLEKDEFIIMPNHFHGIIHLYNDKLEKEYFEKEIKRENTVDKTNKYLNSRSISSIILQFKSKSTKLIREKYSKDFGW